MNLYIFFHSFVNPKNAFDREARRHMCIETYFRQRNLQALEFISRRK